MTRKSALRHRHIWDFFSSKPSSEQNPYLSRIPGLQNMSCAKKFDYIKISHCLEFPIDSDNSTDHCSMWCLGLGLHMRHNQTSPTGGVWHDSQCGLLWKKVSSQKKASSFLGGGVWGCWQELQAVAKTTPTLVDLFSVAKIFFSGTNTGKIKQETPKVRLDI